MTTEFIHDVMYMPLRTRQCLVHFLAHNLFDRNISKKKESMYFYKLSQGLGHGDHGLTNIWIFLTYHELSSLKFDWYDSTEGIGSVCFHCSLGGGHKNIWTKFVLNLMDNFTFLHTVLINCPPNISFLATPLWAQFYHSSAASMQILWTHNLSQEIVLIIRRRPSCPHMYARNCSPYLLVVEFHIPFWFSGLSLLVIIGLVFTELRQEMWTKRGRRVTFWGCILLRWNRS